MEEMVLFGNILPDIGLLHDPKPPRKYRERLLTLDDLTDKELRTRYRFGRNSIIRIADIVREEGHRTSYQEKSFPQYRDAGACRRFRMLLMLRLTSLSSGRQSRGKGDIKQGFFNYGGFPGVVGCIDGTHVRISAPSHDEPSFVNRKGYHSINTQAICDHEGRFTNVTRWPGSVHDSHIFRCLQECTHLEESHLSVQDGLILGDSGYACRSFLMTPYLRPTEPCHEKFNKAHMKTRCCIERTFGWWKKRFNCLHQGIRMRPEKVCKIIMTCAVLHNLAVEMKEPMDEYDNEIVNNDDLNIVFRGPVEGRIMRDHIARGFFS
ncbi:HARBI1 [Mytilus coruscus]|uniref:HARBI1 n=1 Tax=Mytilus coruscus TaxID=42192 RepID=A0A6J8DB15_MYTCO|nr:HARBI1 [Mytilus coruscus]